jgi:hypothetical protein
MTIKGDNFKLRYAFFVLLMFSLLSALTRTASAEDGSSKLSVESATQGPPKGAPANVALDPAWPKQLHIVSDSVVLGAKDTIIRGLPDWKITFQARSALMIHIATKELREQYRSLPPFAIVAVGHNSVWERNRKNFGYWSKRFDAHAEEMLAALRERGVKKVVWVMLRELTPDLVPKGRQAEYEESWYFPYVNERLRLLQQRHPDIALADWPSASKTRGLTYDLIHVNPKGAVVMLKVLKAALGI